MFNFLKIFFKNIFNKETKIEIIEDLENNQITINSNKTLKDEEIFNIIQDVLKKRGIIGEQDD